MPVLAEPSRRFAVLGLAAAAAVQAVAAILFFYAANWWDMAPALKVAGLDLLLVLCALGALLSPPGGFARSTWAAAGAVLSGVLFGVHGQIWQTGADAWELFALWSGLAIVWAAAARSDAAWLVAVLTATAALARWADAVASPVWLAHEWEISIVAAAPLAVGGLWLVVERRNGWLVPVVLALAALLLGFGGFVSNRPLLVALAASGLTFAVAPPRRCGPWPTAIALVLAVVLLEYVLVRELAGGSGAEEALRLLAAALIMLGGLGGLAMALRRLFHLTGLPPGMLERVLGVGIGLGAWIAVAVAATAIVLLVYSLFRYEHAWPLMVVAMVSAAVTARGAGVFSRHVHAASVTIAYGAVLAEVLLQTSSVFQLSDALTLTAVLLVPVVLAASREAMAGAAVTLIALAVVVFRVYDIDSAGVAILAALLAVPGWACAGRHRPSVRAAGTVLLLCVFLLPAGLEFAEPGLLWFCRGAAVFAAAGMVAMAVWTRRDLAQPRLLGAAGLMLAGSLAVPAGGAGLVGLGAASARFVTRLLAVLGVAVAGWSVVRFYYLLALPLDRKAVFLAAGAVLTLLGWVLVHGRPVLARPPRAALLAILAAALLPAVIEAWDWQAKARIVAQGRQVLVPLRPADPRSLIQGDYMALAYDLRLLKDVESGGGLVALRLDGDGVMAGGRRIAALGEAAADEVAVRLGPGRSRPRLGPDSFLFQEGTGRSWAQARFAVLRIHDGALVLAGLADENRRPIIPAKDNP